MGTFLYFCQRSPLDVESFTLPTPLKIPSVSTHDFKLIKEFELDRPEEILVDENEEFFYTGTGDGSLFKVNINDGTKEVLLNPMDFVPNNFKNEKEMKSFCNGDMFHEEKCGRVLGLSFSRDGRSILIANGYIGIFKFDLETKKLTCLYRDDAPKFYNAVVEGPDGRYYFTISHPTFQRYQFLYVFFDGPKGTLHSLTELENYTTEEEEEEEYKMDEIDRNIHFANGLRFTPNDEYLIVAELTKRRLRRYSFNEDSGKLQFDSFLTDNLPIHPDNLEVSSTGTLVIGGYTTSSLTEKLIFPFPFLMKWITRTPKWLHIPLLLSGSLQKECSFTEVDLHNGLILDFFVDVDQQLFGHTTSIYKFKKEKEEEETTTIFLSGSVLRGKAVMFSATTKRREEQKKNMEKQEEL